MWSSGASAFELPVLNQNQGPIAEAAARRAEAAARFNALQAKVLADIDAAVESFRATEKSLALLQDLAATQAGVPRRHRRDRSAPAPPPRWIC